MVGSSRAKTPSLTRCRRSLTAVGLSVAIVSGVLSSARADAWHVLRDPIDPGQLTGLSFGYVSQWLQPWRSSLTTRPATSLQDAIGINFNVTPQEALATARLLHDSGVRRARIELPWDGMSYAHPSRIADPAGWRMYITALRVNRIRPLILLNANSIAPGPTRTFRLDLSATAARGATNVSLTRASAAQVVPGLTGIDTDVGYPLAAGVLITSLTADGRARLSRPLPRRLRAGEVQATTLRYAAFAPPRLADGAPNPRFARTLAGWLTYVKAVCWFVRDAYGSENFDVEVWNELSFGSAFLSERNYFSPVPDRGSTGSVTQALLNRTVQMLRNPADGLTHVRAGDGFSNETPFPSGATVPSGTYALDKHPYPPSLSYPKAQQEAGFPSLDTFGRPSEGFMPTYRSFMPEWPLTALDAETPMRDLSPIRTAIHGTPHGAGTHPAASGPPKVWITEDALFADWARRNGLPAADLAEFQAKAALRFYTSYASEGAQAVDLFAAKAGSCCQLIPQRFFAAADANPASYPAGKGGLTMRAVGRLASTLSGAQRIAHPRQLKLSAIAQDGDDSQFTGNGTAAYPTLYNRDVLTFFPFQASARRFVSAVYVMTRDLTHRYTAHPGRNRSPYDLPPDSFRLTIGNVDAAGATVSLTDPLTGTHPPAGIVSRRGEQIVVQLQATDSPRMLTIDG